MATFLWSNLTNGQVITTFNPAVDVLRFDDDTISAADVSIDSNDLLTVAILSYGGKTVTIQMNPLATTSTNVTFADGSMLLVGDNTTGTVNDDAANTLVGGSGDDQLLGLGGADSLVGGAGNDVFTMYGSSDTVGGGVWGNDTINGGSGGADRIVFPDDNGFGINVNFNVGFSTANGIQGTITGGDGNPGSTITVFGVERVNGTDEADTFLASSLTPVNGLRTDITQVF